MTDSSPFKTSRGVNLVSIYSLTLMLVAVIAAYLTKNENLLVLLAGVVATNATTIVNYFCGTSASSAAKDATIATQLK